MWKRWIWIAAGLFVLVFAGVAALVWRTGRVGETGVEQWVGSQLRTTIAARGKFTLEFQTLDYQYPLKVVIERLQFDRVGGARPIIDVEKAEIELAEVPRHGKPIVIRTIELHHPVVHIDALLKDKPATTQPTTRPDLSSVVTLEHVSIRGGALNYDDDSGEPLSWTNLDADLKLDLSRPSFHRVELDIQQAPLMQLSLSAEVDLDAAAVRDLSLRAKLDLTDPAGRRFFTPPLQRWLDKYEVRGECVVQAKGDASWTKRQTSALSATLQLRNGSAAAGAYRFPIDALDASASLKGTVATIDEMTASVLGGTAKGTGKAVIEDEQTATGELTATGLQLDQLLRRRDNAKQTLAGETQAHIVVQTTLPELRKLKRADGSGITWGTGYVRVDKGRLFNLPVVNDVIAATRKLTNLVTGGDAFRDRLDATFKLVGRRFDFSEILYTGDVIAIRGRGDISFKGDLDLALNVGPLERLQEQLGEIGRLWGKLTDGLMTYRVTGHVKSPEVRAVVGPG